MVLNLESNAKLQQEEKLGSTLRKQLQKSKGFDVAFHGKREVYSVDDMNISFDLMTHMLEVTYKSDNRFVSVNCAQDVHSSLQKARINIFFSVLEAARKRSEREKAKKAREKAAAAKLQQASQVKDQVVQSVSENVK